MNVVSKLSQNLKERIANTAVDYCKYIIPKMVKSKGNMSRGVIPIITQDKITLGVLEGYEYVIYQNRGFKTFVMKELRGKIIPMKIGGRTVFRYADKINWFDGRRANYVRRDSEGNLMRVDEPRRRWTHPGLMPKNFLEKSLAIAFSKHQNEIKRELLYGSK